MSNYTFNNNCNIVLALACVVYIAGTTAQAQQEQSNQTELQWFKGNTHTHSNNQGGDSTPGELAQWYREHDYDFLVISDHNYLAQTDTLQQEIDRLVEREEKKPFLLIPGEEVTNSITIEERSHAIHINGIDTNRTIGKLEDDSVHRLIQKTINAIHDAGGFPHVNHPNFVWSITADDLYSVKRLRHFEIYNGHPKVNVNGGGKIPSLEEFWDDLLSRGRIYYGVATDDAHDFKEWGRHLSNPGRGWIVVRASELSRKALVRAMRAGDFYASTGVVLDDVSSTGVTLRLKINQVRATDNNFELYRTEFKGRGGQVLKTDVSLEPSYQLKPEDLYVRAKVTSSNGSHAWTQPLFAPGQGRIE
jgi:hypothetical protein